MHKLKKRGSIDFETLIIILLVVAILVFFIYALRGLPNVVPEP